MEDYENLIITMTYAAIGLAAGYIWIQGLIGMICTGSIKRTYGGVISAGWAILRMVRALCNGVLISCIVYNMGFRLMGYIVPVTVDNVILGALIIALNVLIYRNDQARFYHFSDRKEAKKMIQAERRLGCSIMTRISLIVTIFSMATIFVLTDTSEYVRGRDGTIYRIKSDGL